MVNYAYTVKLAVLTTSVRLTCPISERINLSKGIIKNC